MCEKSQIQAYSEGDGYKFDAMIDSVRPLFEEGKTVVGNLETPLYHEGVDNRPAAKWTFNTPKEFAVSLKAAGVDIVSTANNHCLDQGIEGLTDSIKILEDIGLLHTGTNLFQEDKRYQIYEEDNIKIAIISYTYGTNAFNNKVYLDKHERYHVNLFQEQELSGWLGQYLTNNKGKLITRVTNKMGRLLGLHNFVSPVYERKELNGRCFRGLKETIKDIQHEDVDIIVMCMHAGGQYNDEPSKYTKNLTRRLIDMGVDIVIGNHEHVIHPIDVSLIKRDKFVAYSLGNFTGLAGVTKPPYDKLADYSLAIDLTLEKNDKVTEISSVVGHILVSHIAEGSKVRTSPVYEHYLQQDDQGKEEIVKDLMALKVRLHVDCSIEELLHDIKFY